MTKLKRGQEKTHPFLPLTCKCDIDLGATDLDPAHDTLSDSWKHFCQMIMKSTKEWQSYRADTKNRPPFFTFDL